MPYGILKVDTITFTDNSVDKSVSLSGLIQNPTFTGNVTATGTISGDVIRGGTTISGVTVVATTIELGNASDTTLSRSAAGVLAVEGVVIPSISSTSTLTNKTLTAPTIASANLTTALTLSGAAGSNGQVLTSAGSGLPSWTTIGAGALTLLSTVTASASATVDVETTFSSTYDAYVLVASKLTCSDNGSDISARFKIGGVYVSGGNDYQHNVITSASDSTSYRSRASDTQTAITILGAASSAASAQSNFTMYLHNPTSTTKQHTLYSRGVVIDNTDASVSQAISVGKCTTLGALTGVRIRPGSGTVSGTFRLYGIANS